MAAAAVKQFNPELNICAHTERVNIDSEVIFHDRFFESLSGVANAVDNIQARLFLLPANKLTREGSEF